MSSKKGPWIVALVIFIIFVFELMPQIRWVVRWVVLTTIILIISIQFIPVKYTKPKK